jgi:uncharacterized protein YbjT (DUF2867 family)
MDTVVLGAGGTLGRWIHEGLVARGHRVTTVARHDARDAAAIARNRPGVIIDCAGASTAMALGKGWRGYGAVDTPIGLSAVQAARSCGARMIYVGVHHPPELANTAYVAAHERVVAAMSADDCVVRATGFFSAFHALLPMAQRGFLVDVGNGRARTNPIDERDLADVVVAAALGREREISAGGPEVMTRQEIFERVAKLANRRVRMLRMPVWLGRIGATLLRPIHPRIAQFAAFACGLANHDVIAPVLGTRRLADCATLAA